MTEMWTELGSGQTALLKSGQTRWHQSTTKAWTELGIMQGLTEKLQCKDQKRRLAHFLSSALSVSSVFTTSFPTVLLLISGLFLILSFLCSIAAIVSLVLANLIAATVLLSSF